MKINYRPEIDGLRAIAVFSVIIYHFNINIFEERILNGGFYGVDIFFVISGYLISSIIFKEIYQNNSFSFLHFYERRIRRILPVLTFVILCTFPFAWLILIPDNFNDYAKSIIFSLFFTSNLFFHYSGKAYGAENAELMPLLHTWSLSIEEQFYIFFPICLFVLIKFFRKYFLNIFLIVFFFSLFFAQWSSINHPYFNFYAFPTRVWELVFGLLLAYADTKIGRNNFINYKFIDNILIVLGLIFILFPIFIFKKPDSEILGLHHPSIFTLIPVIGTGLIIRFAHGSNFIIKILSSKIFVFVGLISYSLYLWHFPIYSFVINLEILGNTNIVKFFLIFLTFILSIFSYYLIEKPFRKKSCSFKKVILFVSTFYVILILISVIIIKQDGFFEKRLPKIFNDLSNFNILKNSNDEACEDNKKLCKFNETKSKKIYLIGDSHAGALADNFKDRIISKNYQLITSIRGGCYFFPEFKRYEIASGLLSKQCTENYFDNLKKLLMKEKNAIVIFVGRLPLYLNQKNFDNQEGGIETGSGEYKFIKTGNFSSIEESFRNSVLDISKNNSVILLYPIPEVGWHVPRKLLGNLLIQKIKKNNIDLKDQNIISTSFKVYYERSKSSFDLLNSIKNENIFRVFPHKIFCNSILEKRCIANDEKNIFYYDTNHPLHIGVKKINSLIIEKIEKIKN